MKAMILNGLGFANRTLYLMPHFFKDKPIERLLGEGIKAEHLNDDTLGRAMDSISDCGTSNFYADIPHPITQNPNISKRICRQAT